jgi:hypothetical protein
MLYPFNIFDYDRNSNEVSINAVGALMSSFLKAYMGLKKTYYSFNG